MFRFAIAMFAGLFLARTASGAVTYTSEDKTAQGDWEVTVDAGDSNVVSAVQSGAGKIIKKGAGYLVFAQANSFTGGVDIEEGFVEAAASDALGSGTITIAGQSDSYTGYCELHVIGAGKDDATVISLPNPIQVTGTTSGAYPAIVFYGQNARLEGDITAAADFCFYEDYNSTWAISSSMYNRYSYVQSATFGGTVTAAGMVGFRGLTRYVFEKAVTATTFDTTITRTYRTYDRDRSYATANNAHGAFVFLEPCTVGLIETRNTPIYCGTTDIFRNTLIRFKQFSNSTGGTGGNFNMYDYGAQNRYDQSVGGLSTVEVENNRANTDWSVDCPAAKTLTITGVAPDAGEETKELVACMILHRKMQVRLDAYKGFTQTFRNWASDMTGSITAEKGTFRVDGTATFSNVTSVVVGKDGCFDYQSTEPGGLKSLTSITVAGEFTLASSDVLGGLGKISIDVASDAKLDLKVTGQVSFKSFSVNGVKKGGVFTHANCPALPEGITVMAYPIVPGETAVWTGADHANNTLTSNMANWQDGPESLDLTEGTLQVTVAEDVKANGAEMTYADDTYFYSILNSLQLTTNAPSISTPFWIKPATPDASLTLYNGLKSREGEQLVLQGHFAAPPCLDVGDARDANPYAVNYRALNFTASTKPQGIIESTSLSSTSARCVPLVAAGVTVDLPVYIHNVRSTQGTVLLGYPNTHNVFNKEVYAAGYQSNCSAMEGSVLEFRGGVSGAACFRYLGPGEIRVVDVPFSQGSGLVTEHGVKLVLDAEDLYVLGNSTREGFLHGSGTVAFRRSYCFKRGDMQFYLSSKTAQLTVDFNATTQRVGVASFNNTNKGTYLTGIYPAMLETTGNVRAGADASQIQTPLCNVPVTGGLGFHQCGEGNTFTLAKQDFASCGDLEVSGGTLELAADASWLNGTNVTARGTGVLKFSGAYQINGAFARAHFADEGSFELAGVQRVASAEVCVDGVWQQVPHGWYTAASTGLMAGRITGTGKLRVGAPGFVINVR